MIILLLLSLFLTAASINAQDASLFEQYKNDYAYHRDLYQQAYLNYVNKKQIHTTYATLITLNDQITAAKQAMIVRHNFLRSYLLALRTKLEFLTPMDPNTTEKVQIDLNRWEDWLNEQNTIVDSLNNPEDLSQYVAGFKKQYRTIQELISTALVVDEINLRYHTLGLIRALSTDIGANPNLNSQNQQWLSSIVVKSDLVTKNLTQAYELTQSNKKRTGQFNDPYPISKKELNQANNYLIEMASGLKSIVTKLNF